MHAFHASEVPYMFGSLGRMTPLWPKIPDTAAERSLSAAMVDYWASFTRSGLPRAKAQPDWPQHNSAHDYMLFADRPTVARDLLPGEFRLHDEVVCRRRAAGNIAWNWNVGVSSPPLPPAAKGCK